MTADHAGMDSPVVLIAARMTSTRLPGKALMQFGGNVLLGHVIDAAFHAHHTSGVVVVTSTHGSDDPIDDWCSSHGVSIWRGPLDDVASRMVGAAKHYERSAFVRISGDSPMIDPAIISEGSALFASGSYDLVTNVNPRAFPPGQSVEVVSASILDRFIREGALSKYDREHVTPVLYRNQNRLRVRRFGPIDVPSRPSPSLADKDFTGVTLTVDTADDAARFRAILQGLNGEPAWCQGWYRCVQLFRQASVSAASPRGEKHD
jgi:spore coat polysaccharide biosynthesis protein SpsF